MSWKPTAKKSKKKTTDTQKLVGIFRKVFWHLITFLQATVPNEYGPEQHQIDGTRRKAENTAFFKLEHMSVRRFISTIDHVWKS